MKAFSVQGVNFLILCFIISCKSFYLCAQNNDSLNYAFLDAVYESDSAKVVLSLKGGADVRFKTRDSLSALHYSVINEEIGITSLLLEYGADADSRDQGGNTPLMLASDLGIDTIMFLLIMYDAGLDLQNNEGETALHFAVLSGNPVAADMLLYYKAKPDIQNNEGCTALHYAAYNGMDEIIELLLQAGSNAEIKDKNGEDPRFYAVYANSPGSLKLLFEKNRDITTRNSLNYNIAEIIFMNGNLEVLNILLKSFLPENAENHETAKFLSENLNAREVWKSLLIKDMREHIRLAREFHIKRPLHPITGSVYTQIALTASDDFFASCAVSLQEVNYRFYLGAGIGTRIWKNRMFLEKSADTLYQLREYRAFFWPEISKYMTVYRSVDKRKRVDLFFGLKSPLTWANYSGLKERESLRFTFAAFSGIDYLYRGIKLNLTYQYWEYDVKNFSRHQITLGFAFR